MIVSILRKVLPQELINKFYHLPKAVLANIIYGFPSKGLTVIGVSGTDGKTTTTNMIYQILKSAGFEVSAVSTLGAIVGNQQMQTGAHVTSPGSMELQKLFKKAKDNGDKYFVLEVTSHGLDQYRFFGINFEIGVITNITHEHLDYHKNWENYFRAKARLISNNQLSILNKDEEANFQRLKKLAKGKVVSFGLSKSADFNPVKFPIKLQLPGEYNQLNALAACAVALNLNVSLEVIKETLSSFKSLNGRMEKVANKKGLNIYIDFAHTPNGLKQALKALKNEHKKGKIICLTGAEGYRDVSKRKIMGQIAAKLSDVVIITAVDPRGLIDQINEQMKSGAVLEGKVLDKNLFLINDRYQAIDLAIKKLAKRGDTIGIFGKGHEETMNIDGKGEAPWSDKKAVAKVLQS